MKIVFFDGHCNLCNAAIDFLLRHDHHRNFKFASLQGETARHNLTPEVIGDLQTMVYQEGDQIWFRSTAALKAGAELGGAYYYLAHLALWVPESFRDQIYRSIASRRYSWFGRRSTCRLPSAEEAQAFLP